MAVSCLLGRIREHPQRKTTCIFRMVRSNVSFVPTKADGIVVSGHGVVFDWELPVETESKTFFCVGSGGRRSVKVLFVVLEGNDKLAMQVER